MIDEKTIEAVIDRLKTVEDEILEDEEVMETLYFMGVEDSIRKVLDVTISIIEKMKTASD